MRTAGGSHNLSVSCADSIPTPFVPSGHFPLIGGIGPWKGSQGAASFPDLALGEADADGGAFVRGRFGGDGVAELPADCPAQIEAEAAGLLVAAAVVAGVALFKDSW